MSVFDDSDDDPMVAEHGKAEPDVVCLSSSSSSLATEVKETVNDSTPYVRNCHTLNDYAPVAKQSKKNKSSTYQTSSQSCYSDPVAGTSKSIVQSPAKPAKRRDLKTRSPSKKTSERDCLALISDKFVPKYFKERDVRRVFYQHEVRFRYDATARMQYAVTFAREIVNEFGCKEERIEDQVLVMVRKEEFVHMIDGYNRKKNSSTKSSDTDSEPTIGQPSTSETPVVGDLVDYVSRIMTIYPKMHITLIITGMAAYFKSQREKMETLRCCFRSPSKTQTTSDLPDVTKQDVTAALTDLNMRVRDIMGEEFRINCYQYERAHDVLMHIASFTKSVAEAPTQKALAAFTEMRWCADKDKKGPVNLKDLEKDSVKLWRKQLEKFPRVSREVADAIIKIYPTVTSLRRAYDRLDDACGTILLQDIPVGKRRIGPDISRKIHLFFTSNDGDIFM